MFDAYAKKVSASADIAPGRHSRGVLRQIVHGMPFQEAPVERLEVMDETITIESFARRYFFDVIHSERDLGEMNTPFLISGALLQNLEGWGGWMTLVNFLHSSGLRPEIAFRNTHVPRNGQIYFVANLRVLADQLPKFGKVYDYIP